MGGCWGCWRRGERGRYDQSTLYTCMKFSENKKDDFFVYNFIEIQ